MRHVISEKMIASISLMAQQGSRIKREATTPERAVGTERALAHETHEQKLNTEQTRCGLHPFETTIEELRRQGAPTSVPLFDAMHVPSLPI